VIPIAIVIVVFLALGLVFGPSMINQITGNGTKTYDNSSLGVSFDYPGNWEIYPIQKVFSNEETKAVYVGDPNYKYNLTPSEQISPCYATYYKGFHIIAWTTITFEEALADDAEYLKEKSNEGYNVSERNITVDGIPAHEQRYSNNETVEIDVTLEKNGQVYTFSFRGLLNDKNWESQYNMIINSLRFK